MGDWLKTFGTFQANLPANLGVDDYYIPTNSKSLVVSHKYPFPQPCIVFHLSVFFRYRFSLLEHSLAHCLRSRWEIWLVVNGELSHRAQFSLLVWACNLIRTGQCLSLGELSPESVWYAWSSILLASCAATN